MVRKHSRAFHSHDNISMNRARGDAREFCLAIGVCFEKGCLGDVAVAMTASKVANGVREERVHPRAKPGRRLHLEIGVLTHPHTAEKRPNTAVCDTPTGNGSVTALRF